MSYMLSNKYEFPVLMSLSLWIFDLYDAPEFRCNLGNRFYLHALSLSGSLYFFMGMAFPKERFFMIFVI